MNSNANEIMDGKDFTAIVGEMEALLSKTAKTRYSDFYVGITDSLNDSLAEHYVRPGRCWYVARIAKDYNTAVEVENYFKQKGMRFSNKPHPDQNASAVFCYAVSPTTVE
jgi:hypothetical protein